MRISDILCGLFSFFISRYVHHRLQLSRYLCTYIYWVIRRPRGSVVVPGSPAAIYIFGSFGDPRVLSPETHTPHSHLTIADTGLNRAVTTWERGSPHPFPPISTLIIPELALFSCGSNRCVTFFVLPVILRCTDVNTFSLQDLHSCTEPFMN